MDAKLRLLTKERLVFGTTGLFFVGLIVFVAGVRADLLEVALILVGVLLAALIPEVLSDAPQRRRLLLMSVPIAGVAIVQILDSAAGATQLSNQISAVQLSAIHDRIRRCEEIAQEQVTPDPRDALQALSTANRAMEYRANIVAMRVEIYQARASNTRLAASARARARQTLAGLRREEAHYRAAAGFIANVLRP